jgi:hypothetical protein
MPAAVPRDLLAEVLEQHLPPAQGGLAVHHHALEARQVVLMAIGIALRERLQRAGIDVGPRQRVAIASLANEAHFLHQHQDDPHLAAGDVARGCLYLG